jgi:hypothetical protein
MNQDPFDWPVVTSFNRIQKGKDYLDHEMISFHSEVFQAKFILKQLEKANAKLLSKLVARRTVSVFVICWLVCSSQISPQL